MVKNEAGYEMVSSYDDLLGRLLVASERKISHYNVPDEGIWILGLPNPADASNGVLSELLPLYITLTKNAINADENCILNRLDESEDQAILLLYILEYPIMCLCARFDVTGFTQCNIKEQFEMADIARRIITNSRLLFWCRNAIALCDSNRTSSIFASAVNILGSVNDAGGILESSRAQNLIRRYIFQGLDDYQGFLKLHDDLAGILSRASGPQPQLVANSIILQRHIIRTIYDVDHVATLMGSAPKQRVFEMALLQVKDSFDHSMYQSFRLMLGCDENGDMQQLPGTNSKPTRRVYICANDDCQESTDRRCTRCYCVGYCTRKCQVAHWKKHKQVCKSKPKPVEDAKVAESADSVRSVASPALIRQDELLKENPNLHYVIDLPSGKHNIGVFLGDPDCALLFRIARSKAPNEKGCVSRMYEWLSISHPKEKEIIRKQLLAEYGVDPESDEARTGPVSEITEMDLRKANYQFY